MPYLLRLNSILICFLLHMNVLAQPDFTASATEGCTPLRVKFAIDPTTVDMDTIDRIDWNFGNGNSITGNNPDTVTYEAEGIYTVSMVINSYWADRIVKPDYITVHRTISAVFRFEEYATNFNYRFIPLDEITDPDGLYFYTWHYEKLSGTDTRVNDYTVGINTQDNAIDSVALDTGMYLVFLVIDDTFGCSSRSEKIVQVSAKVQIPNVFVPDVEEFYIIDPQSLNTILQFEVYNRYGMLVFSQIAPIINWNGKTNSGQNLNTGVYYYILKSVKGDPAKKYNQYGFIHLYR